jgi:hypothetical protein
MMNDLGIPSEGEDAAAPAPLRCVRFLRLRAMSEKTRKEKGKLINFVDLSLFKTGDKQLITVE